MKQEIAAIVILLLLLFGSLVNIRYLDSDTEEMCSLMDEAMDFARAGDLASAVEKAEAAANYWAELDGYTHIFIRHPEIDATTDAFCELLGELYAGDVDEAQGAHLKLRERLLSMARMEHITFGSVF